MRCTTQWFTTTGAFSTITQPSTQLLHHYPSFALLFARASIGVRLLFVMAVTGSRWHQLDGSDR